MKTDVTMGVEGGGGEGGGSICGNCVNGRQSLRYSITRVAYGVGGLGRRRGREKD